MDQRPVSTGEVEGNVEDLTETEDEEIGREIKYAITSYGADYPVDSLVKRIDDGSLVVPAFQRNFVWKRSQASRFVESLLLGLPVPGIFLARQESDVSRLVVVDGQQRLWTLHRFYKGVWENSVFRLMAVGPSYEGKSVTDLSQSDRRRLDDSIIHATIVKQDKPEDDDGSIYAIFERINTTGTLLSAQEIRATVSRGPFNDLLGKLNEDPYWREIFGPVSPRLKDQELILRFLCLFFSLDRYRRPMKDALNTYMFRNRALKVNGEDELRQVFSSTVRTVVEGLGPKPFRPIRALNAAVFDAAMVGVAKRLASRPVNKPELSQAYQELIANSEFLTATTRSTSDDSQVRTRIELAVRAFAER